MVLKARTKNQHNLKDQEFSKDINIFKTLSYEEIFFKISTTKNIEANQKKVSGPKTADPCQHLTNFNIKVL